MRNGFLTLGMGLLAGLLLAGAAGALEPGPSPPPRPYSAGDSTTPGFAAAFFGDPSPPSWVNGCRGSCACPLLMEPSLRASQRL